MHKLLSLTVVLYVVFSFSVAGAEESSASVNSVLYSAENFFVSLSAGEYEVSWELLTEKSRKRIIDDVYKSSRKMNMKVDREGIAKIFNKKGVLFIAYWSSFCSTFDTEMVLEHSLWEMGYIEDDRAEIIISYNKSDWPARLKMLKENNVWKVGIAESFWKRKLWQLRFYKEFL